MAALWSWPPSFGKFDPGTDVDYLPSKLWQTESNIVWRQEDFAFYGDTFANYVGYGSWHGLCRFTGLAIPQTTGVSTPGGTTDTYNGNAWAAMVSDNGYTLYNGFYDSAYWGNGPRRVETYHFPDSGQQPMVCGSTMLKAPHAEKRVAMVQQFNFSRWVFEQDAHGLTSPFFILVGGPAGYALLVQNNTTTVGSEALVGVTFNYNTGAFGTPTTLLAVPGVVSMLEKAIDMTGGHFHLALDEYLLNLDISGASPVVTTLRTPASNPGQKLGSPVQPFRAARLAGGVLASCWWDSIGDKLYLFHTTAANRSSVTAYVSNFTVDGTWHSNAEILQLENNPDTGHAALVFVRADDLYPTSTVNIDMAYVDITPSLPSTINLVPTTQHSFVAGYPSNSIYSMRSGTAMNGDLGYNVLAISTFTNGGLPTVVNFRWSPYNTPKDVFAGMPMDTRPRNGLRTTSSVSRSRQVLMDARSAISTSVRITLELGYAAKYNWAIASSSEQTASVTMDGRVHQNMVVGAVVSSPVTTTMEQRWTNMGSSWMEEFTSLMNAERESLGLPPVAMWGADGKYPGKNDMAQLHAQNSANAQYMEHNGTQFPEGYQTLWQRLDKVYTAYGSENMLGQLVLWLDDFTTNPYVSPQDAFDAWKDSPPHYANMIRDWGTYSDSMYMMMGHSLSTTLQPPYGSLEPAVWLILCNVFVFLEDTMIRNDLQHFWNNDGAVIAKIPQLWDNASFVNVKKHATFTYGICVSAQNELAYGCRTAAEHSAPITYAVATQFSVLYEPTQPVAKLQHETVYGIKNTVTVAAQNDTPWGLSVGSTLSLPYTATTPVYGRLSSPYADLVLARAQSTASYELSPLNRVTTAMQGSYTMEDAGAALVSNNSVYVNYAGGSLRVSDGVISSGPGDIGYSFEFSVYEIGTFQQLYEGQTIDVDFCGEQYTFVVSKKSISRSSPADISMRVDAISPAAMLDAPYATESSYTQETDSLASALVDGIIEIDFTYEIVDWLLPKGRLQATASTPLGIVSELASAVGGVVDATRLGELRVRYVYPHAMNDLASATLAHTYTDSADNISASSSSMYRDGANKFRVREGEASFTDTLQWQEDESQVDPAYLTGKLRAYLSPWRDTVTIKHLGGAAYLLAPTDNYEHKEQMVEFTGGTGSVDLPMETLTSVEWVTADLGVPTFTPYSNTLTVGTLANDGRGLAKVSYRTRYLEAAAGGIPQYVESGEVGPYTAYAYFVLEDSNG